MKMKNCLILIAEHEEAAQDYHDAVTEADRKAALETLNEIQHELFKNACR